MYLRRLISVSILFLSFLSSKNTFGALADSTVRVPSPYKNEYNPWFKLSTFNRGFKKDSLAGILDQLEAKKRTTWTRYDSLLFATTSMNTGNLELSNYYFDLLVPTYSSENNFWWEYITLQLLSEKYDKGLRIIRKDHTGILEYSEVYFLEKIFEAKIAQKNDPKWYKKNSITNFKVDSSRLEYDKTKKLYQDEIITPLTNLNKVLKRLIRHIYDSDPVIARTCFEMGHVLEVHVSWTQAYIAYSLGRNYNKRDKELLAEIKTVKGKLSSKKYKIPIFRRYFPSTEKWRFDYEVLKQKIITEKNDTLNKVKPDLMLPPQKNDFLIPPQLIRIIGIIILFVIVLFFVRTKKK